MPNLEKATKEMRDRGAIAGIRKYFRKWAGREEFEIRGVTYTAESFAAPFEEHLRAMQRVHELTIERSVAVERERKLWASLEPLYESRASLATSAMGPHSHGLREVGVQPHKEHKVSTEGKARAVEKRRATRQALGPVGKKQRALAKRKLRGG